MSLVIAKRPAKLAQYFDNFISFMNKIQHD